MPKYPKRCVCPHFQGDDARCAERFTLNRMAEVFEFCLGAHDRCSVYHELTIDVRRATPQRLAQAG
ncbi:MAG: hypothetical protein V3T70_07115 [Phycisphaerae bacterium]